MRKKLLHGIAGLGTALALLGGAGAALAADLALIASGGSGGVQPQLADSLVSAYRDAGYRVIDARGADRAELVDLLAEFERDAEASDRLVIHLVGPLAESGGLILFMPRNASPDSISDIMAQGLPLPLFLDLVDRGEGRGMLALGITNFDDQQGRGLNAPPGVLLMRGYPLAVNAVVIEQMLAKGLSAGEIDTRALAVEVDGQVTNSFRLTGARVRGPAEREDELELTEKDQLRVQKDLNLMGFEPGPADGIFGSGTREAIRDWQAANGFPETGYLTAAQIEALSGAADATRADLRAATASLQGERGAWRTAREADTRDAYRAYLAEYPEGRHAEDAEARIAALEDRLRKARKLIAWRDAEDALELSLDSGAMVERRLALLGYDTGPADGRLDRQTRRALEVFQESRDLEASGYLDVATLRELVAVGAEE